MKLEIHEQEDLFEQLKPEWNDLLKRSPADMIFSTWEWQSTWWAAYHPGKLWVITCREADGRLVGLAPCFIDAEGVVRGIGCEDVTDYIDVIVDKDCLEPVFNEFAAFFASCRSQYSGIQICNIPEASPTYQQFPQFLEQHQFTVRTEQQDVIPLIVLPDAWDDYLSGLDKKQRHEVRRKLRKINSVAYDWYTVDSSHDLKAEMGRFLALMAASDDEKNQFLQDEQNVAFFQQFVPVAFDNNWLRLCFLRINGEAIAAYLNFDYNNQILVYNSGQVHGPHDNLSPGIVLLANLIRESIEKDYAEFNFLRGDEVYKYRMGGQDTRVFKLIAE